METATTGAVHVPLAFITQNDGYPRAAQVVNAVDAVVPAITIGATHEPVEVIIHAAGKPIALHD